MNAEWGNGDEAATTRRAAMQLATSVLPHESTTMRLWTHHPSTFQVDDPHERIDRTLGEYWKDSMGPDFRYREVLPRLQNLVGTDQFLWCCTVRGCYPVGETTDSIEWELNEPFSQILAFYRETVWLDIILGRGDDWDNLLIQGISEEEAADKDIGALVRFPVTGRPIRRLGPHCR